MPSDTLTIETDSGEHVRQPRERERPVRDRVQPERDSAITIETVTADGVDPTEIVARSADQIKQADRSVAEARRAAAVATQRQQAAELALQQSQADRIIDHGAVLAATVESAKSEQAAARTAMRAAREIGDIEAEMEATETRSAATHRLTQASGELAQVRAITQNSRRNQPAPVQQQSGRSAEAQAWLDSHPAFNSDLAYRGVAIEAHNDALRFGLSEGSRAYVDHIDRIMEETYGEGHGQTAAPPRQPPRSQQDMSGRNGRAGDRTGSALPPSRGGGGGGGGWEKVSTILTPGTPLLVQNQGGGKMTVKFSSHTQQADFQEGADACKMSLNDYVLDQISIAKEIASGGNGDLVVGEGQTFGRNDR